jgi:hypothetical protein
MSLRSSGLRLLPTPRVEQKVGRLISYSAVTTAALSANNIKGGSHDCASSFGVERRRFIGAAQGARRAGRPAARRHRGDGEAHHPGAGEPWRRGQERQGRYREIHRVRHPGRQALGLRRHRPFAVLRRRAALQQRARRLRAHGQQGGIDRHCERSEAIHRDGSGLSAMQQAGAAPGLLRRCAPRNDEWPSSPAPACRSARGRTNPRRHRCRGERSRRSRWCRRLPAHWCR